MNNADQPIHPQSNYSEPKGLTKREYFAAMAMQGMLASQYDDMEETYFPGFDITAKRAIAYANALLKQLES